MNRYAVRCGDCLTVSFIEADAEPRVVAFREGRPVAPLACGACGGPVTSMGAVHKARLVSSSDECPCDGRCTGARGPSCDCKCGGENHGSQRLVEVVRDAGQVPTVRPVDADVALERATEFRAARDAARAVLAERFPVIAGDSTAYASSARARLHRHNQFRAEIRDAAALKTHRGRCAALARLVAREAAPAEVRS